MHHRTAFASFIALLRDFLRPGVLWFFRDPNEPEFHPLKQMLTQHLVTYARRLLLINIMCGFLILSTVYIPIKLALLGFPALVPMNISLSHPAEFLLLNLGTTSRHRCSTIPTCSWPRLHSLDSSVCAAGLCGRDINGARAKKSGFRVTRNHVALCWVQWACS